MVNITSTLSNINFKTEYIYTGVKIKLCIHVKIMLKSTRAEIHPGEESHLGFNTLLSFTRDKGDFSLG